MQRAAHAHRLRVDRHGHRDRDGIASAGAGDDGGGRVAAEARGAHVEAEREVVEAEAGDLNGACSDSRRGASGQRCARHRAELVKGWPEASVRPGRGSAAGQIGRGRDRGRAVLCRRVEAGVPVKVPPGGREPGRGRRARRGGHRGRDDAGGIGEATRAALPGAAPTVTVARRPNRCRWTGTALSPAMSAVPDAVPDAVERECDRGLGRHRTVPGRRRRRRA